MVQRNQTKTIEEQETLLPRGRLFNPLLQPLGDLLGPRPFDIDVHIVCRMQVHHCAVAKPLLELFRCRTWGARKLVSADTPTDNQHSSAVPMATSSGVNSSTSTRVLCDGAGSRSDAMKNSWHTQHKVSAAHLRRTAPLYPYRLAVIRLHSWWDPRVVSKHGLPVLELGLVDRAHLEMGKEATGISVTWVAAAGFWRRPQPCHLALVTVEYR